jgi:hypothetical protein
MKQKLQIGLIAMVTIAALALLFPFRTATFKIPGKADSEASMGPTFIFMNPDKLDIFQAIFEKPLKNLDVYTYSYALQSRLDYGRTLALMLPFVAGAFGCMFWLRIL